MPDAGGPSKGMKRKTASEQPKTAPQPRGRPAVFAFRRASRSGIGLRLRYHCVAAAGDGTANVQYLRLQLLKGDLSIIQTFTQLIDFVHDGLVVRYMHGGDRLLLGFYAGFNHFHQPVG